MHEGKHTSRLSRSTACSCCAARAASAAPSPPNRRVSSGHSTSVTACTCEEASVGVGLVWRHAASTALVFTHNSCCSSTLSPARAAGRRVELVHVVTRQRSHYMS